MNENAIYRSSDLSLIAALISFGARIETVDYSTPPRATFCVIRERGLDEIVQAFYAHSLKVDPLVYFQALKEAKTRLYADHR